MRLIATAEIKVDSSRCYRLVKEGSWIVVGQIASVLGSLVLVRVLTGHLNPAQYGQLALGLTIAGLVNQIVMGGVSSGIGRFYSIAAEKQDLPGYLRASGRFMGYATLAVLAIGLALMGVLFFLGYSQWMGLAAAVLVFSVLSGYNNTLSGIQNAARQRAIVAFHGGLDAWLKILLAVGAMLWLGNSSTAVVIGYTLSSLLVTGSQSLFLRHLVSYQAPVVGDNIEWVRQMWAYSWPFSAWGVFSWAQQSSDRWALEHFTTMEDVGLYATLFQLGYTPISITTGLAMSFLGPILYQRSGDATDPARNSIVSRLTWRITGSSLLVTLVAFLCVWVFHRWIFELLVASEYRGVSYLLPWVVLAGGLFAAGQVFSLKMMSDLKSAAMVRAKIATAVLGILFNIFGAALAGVKGIIVGLIAFTVLYFVWMVLLSFSLSTKRKACEGAS